MPSYIKALLNKGDNNLNIFTGRTKAPNPDYFKTIWRRFKRVSKLLEQDQHFTLLGIQELYKSIKGQGLIVNYKRLWDIVL